MSNPRLTTPYKGGPSTCPKCGAPTHYTASGDTESQGAFGKHRYVEPQTEQHELQERIATALENIWEELRLRNRACGVFPE